MACLISLSLTPLFPCENFSEISRGRDLGAFYWRDLAEMKISAANSAAKNAPRLVARSRRDENLGGQKRAEIRGEISAAKIAPRLREISAAKIASS